MTDAKPLVSVVLPTFNRAGSIGASINSVLAQTYREFELIIVDDGSSDETDDVIAGYSDERIRYIHTPSNRGAAGARNYGIENASKESEYIAFEDSDDLWHADKLEKQLKAIETEQNAGFCYHKIRYDMGGGYSAILPDERIPVEKKSGDIYSQLLYENMVDCPSMLIKKELLAKVGVFNESYKALEDYDLALRMAKLSGAAFVDEVLLESAYSTTGVSGSTANYLIASCQLLAAYKADYLASGHFDHRVEVIVEDAKRAGMQDQIVALLEKLLAGGSM